MTRRIHLLALILLSGFGAAAGAEAQEQDGQDAGTHFMLRQRLALQLHPMGAEHYLELASRTAVGDQGSLWFAGAHFEAGVLSAASPVYLTGGGYMQLSPLSFLVLRAQLTGEGIWPIGMPGAGFYGFETYDPHLEAPKLSMSRCPPAGGPDTRGPVSRKT